MNRIFKKVWNRARGCYVAVNETVKGAAQASGKTAVLVGALSAALLPAAFAQTAYGVLEGMTTSSNYRIVGGDAWGEDGPYDSYGAEGWRNNTVIGSAYVQWLSGTGTGWGYGVNVVDGTNVFKENSTLYINSQRSVKCAVCTLEGTLSFYDNAKLIVENSSYNATYYGTIENFTGTVELRGNSTGTFTTHSGRNIFYKFDGVIDNYSTLYLNSQGNGWATSGSGYVRNRSGGTINANATALFSGGTVSTGSGNPYTRYSAIDFGGSSRYPQVRDLSRTVTYGTASGTWSAGALLNNYFTRWDSGSTLYINDISEGTDAANQLRSIFRSKYGYSPNITFMGGYILDAVPGLDGTSSTPLTLSTIQTGISQGDISNQTVFAAYEMNGGGSALTIGSSGNITQSIGFGQIRNAGSITVKNGATLALVGSTSSETTLANTTVRLTSGNLMLGNPSWAGRGVISSLSMDGGSSATVSRGTYRISSLTGSGSLNVNGGSLTTGSADVSSASVSSGASASFGSLSANSLTNAGSAVISDMHVTTVRNTGSMTVNGGFNFTSGSSLTSSGTLRTALGNVFVNITDTVNAELKYVGLENESAQGEKIHTSSLFQKYVPGSVNADLAAHATFSGGTLIVDNSSRALTQTQANDLKAAFAAKFGSATNVTFTGTVSGTSRNDTLTAAKVNQLHDAGVGLDGVIYIDRNFDGESRTALFGSGGVRNDAGFAGIGSATGVTVQDGTQLVLVGAAGNANYALTSATAKVTGTGSEMKLGSLGLTNAAGWQGRTAAVELEDGGMLHAAAGDYTVVSLKGAGGASQVKTDAGAKLSLGSVTLTSGAGFTNAGTTTVTGSFEGTGGGTYTNTGSMTVEGALNAVGNASLTNSSLFTAKNGISLIGTLTNQRGGTLNVTGDTLVNSTSAAFVNEGTAVLNGGLSVAGTLSNTAGAVLQTNKLSVTGQINNYGLIEATDDSTLYGTLTNAGTISLYNVTVGSSGRLDNTGLSHAITGVGTVTVNGLLTNVNNAEFSGEILNVSGANAEVRNEAAMELNELTVTSGGVLTSTGSLRAQSLTVGAGARQSSQNVAASTSNYALGGARASTRSSEQIRTLTVDVGGSKANDGDAWYGEGTISGTFTNGENGYVIAGISDIWPDGTGFAVTDTGVIANAGVFVAAGGLSNAGTIRGDGEFVLQREGAGANVFTNSGSFDVGILTTDGITYSQTAGSTTAQAGGFLNSAVNVSGGTLYFAGGTGTGNTYTIGDGTSDVTVATAEFGTLDSASTVNIIEGGELKALTISLDGAADTVNLMGGKLVTTLDQIFSEVYCKAWEIDAQGPEDEVNFSGVNVATGVSDIKASVSSGINFGYGLVAFNDAVYSAVMASDVLGKLDDDDVDPAGHEGLLEVAFNGAASEAFTVTLANQVRASGVNGTTFATFTNETLTNKVNPDSGCTKLYVGTEGNVPADANVLGQSIGFKNVVGVTDGITVADGKHLVLVGDLQSSPWAPEAILDGDLTIRDSVTTVTLGSYATEGKTQGSIKNIALNEGGVLRVRHGDFVGQWLTASDGTIYIGGDGLTLVNGMTLTADTDSSLTLNGYTAGSDSQLLNWGTFTAEAVAASGTGGGEIVNRGTMTLRSGDFDGFITNEGNFISDSLALKSGDYTTAFDNAEDASAEIGMLTAEAGTEIVNAGELNASTGISTAGVLKNSGGTMTVGTLTVAAGGRAENAGTLTAGALQSAGQVMNLTAGTMTLSQTGDSVLTSQLANAGTLVISGSGTFDIAAGGTLINTGTLNASGPMTVSGGTLTHRSSRALNLGDLTITAGEVVFGGGRVTGTGTLEVNAPSASAPLVSTTDVVFNTVKITAGTVSGTGSFGLTDEHTGSFTIGAQGVLSLTEGAVYADAFANEGAAAIGTLSAASAENRSGASLDFGLLSGTVLTNAGTVHTTGPAELLNSTVVGTGLWTADANTLISGGRFTQSSSDAASFGELTLADGAALAVNTGTRLEASALLGRAGTQIENAGTITGAMTLSGAVTGTGTLDGLTGIVSVTETGAVTQGTIIGVLENAGGITVGTLASNGASANTGTLTVADRIGGTGSLLNDDAGTMTTDGMTVAGDFTNRGTFTATGEVVLDEGGSITAASDRTMVFTDLTITDGLLTVSASAGASGTGTLTVGLSDPAATGVVNSGVIDFANLHVASGTVTGTGTFGSGSSSVAVDADGTVTQNTVKGTLANSGSVTAKNAVLETGSVNSGAIALTEAFEGTLPNASSGQLTLGAADGNFVFTSGNLTNEGTLEGLGTVTLQSGTLAQSSSTAAAFEDLILTNGVLDIDAGSAVTGDALTVTAGIRGHEALVNDGTAAFDGITVTRGTVSGTGTLGSAASVITVSANGIVTLGTLEGVLTNAGTVTADRLISHGESTNRGTLTVHDRTEGNLTNTAGGTLIFAGTGGAVIASGTVTNLGTLTATEKLTVAGGSLVHDSAVTAQMTDLTVETGSVTVTDGKIMIGSGLLTVGTAGSAANDGTMIFANASVSGAVTGSGVFGSADSVTNVLAGGSLAQNTLSGKLANAGSVTLTDAVLTAGSTNGGYLTVNGSFRGDLTNTASGTFTGNPTGTVEILEGGIRNEGAFATNGVKLSGGDLTQASDTVMDIGELIVADGVFTVEAGRSADIGALSVTAGTGSVVNDGAILADSIELLAGTVSGTGTLGDLNTGLTVADGVSVVQGTVKGILTNSGSITADNLELGTGGASVNSSGGTISVHDSIKGSLANDGLLTAAGTGGLLITDGTLTNRGTFTASEAVTIRDGGSVLQQSSSDMTLTDLTVGAGGRLEVGTGTALRGTGTLTVSGSAADAEQILSSGTIDFAAVTVEKGVIAGTGTIGSGSAQITVGSDGTIRQGTALAGTIANAGTLVGSITADTISNTGTITAGTITASYSLLNEGRLTASGSADLTGFENRAGAAAVFEDSALIQNSVLGGSVTAEAGLTLEGTNTLTGSLLAEDGVKVKNGTAALADAGAAVTVTGGIVLDNGTLDVRQGELTADRLTLCEAGKLVTSDHTSIGELTGTGGTLELAGGTIDLGRITASSTDVLISSATDITAAKGWFTDSSINIEAGHFNADTIIHDDAGNLTGDLGRNTWTVGGAAHAPVQGPDSLLPAADKADWKASYAVLSADRITSDSIINVASGGVLDVNRIELTPETSGVTVTIGTGGGLQTSLDQFFDSVTTSVVDLEAVDAETGRVDIVTDVIATTTVGNVIDSVKNGLVFENGSMVAFDDEGWTTELVVSVTNSLTRAGLIGSDVQVEQHYLGEFGGDFTVDTASSLIEEQRLLTGGSAVLAPGIVFDTTTLHNNTAADGGANRSLVIGIADGSSELPSGANGIEVSMGFMNVAGAEAVTVTNGCELALVGSARPDNFDWRTDFDDSRKLLADAADGGTVTVEDGVFTMGSWGVSGPTAGWIGSADVRDDGELVTKNGEFAAWDLDNAGTVAVTAGSVLHTTDVGNSGSIHIAGGFTAGGVFTNSGSLLIEQDASAGLADLVTAAGSEIVSDGTLTLGRADDIKGSLTNAEHGTLAVESDSTVSGTLVNQGTAHWQDLTVSGSAQNSGYEDGGTLTVAEGGTKTNTGTSVWQIADIAGTLVNTASGEGLGLRIGTDAEGEHFIVSGDFTNAGSLDASGAEMTTVSGSVSNAGTALYDGMTVTGTGSSVNTGYEKGGELTVLSGGGHRNTGTSLWHSISLEAGASGTNGEAIPEGAPRGHEEGFSSEAVTAVGSEDLRGSLTVNGGYANNGILNAANADTSVGGTLTNSGKALYDDMSVTEGGSSVNLGYEKGDTLTVGGSHENSGVSIWNGIVVSSSGEVRNTADGVTDVNGRFDVEGTYTNEGLLDATGTPMTNVSGELVNTGTAGYDDMTVASGGSSVNSGAEHGDRLTVKDGGVHANTGTSVWNEVAIELGGRDVFGSEAADESFVIGGIYTNDGTIDATKAETIVVTGGLTNSGTAGYDDIRIAEGGTSVNAGREEGDILTVEGSHGNTGTSIWTGITVEESGSVVNGNLGEDGTPDADAILKVGTGSDHDGFVIKGEALNNGTLSATEVETTKVEGTLVNRGNAAYDDLSIAEGGTSVNAGREEGDILTVEGSHRNTGTSIWTGITVEENGSLVNGNLGEDGTPDADALLKIGTGSENDSFVIKGEAINNGILNATEVETTQVEGTLVNRGNAYYEDMHVAEGGTSVNAGREEGDVLTVEGTHDNSGISEWSQITVAASGETVNREGGELTVGSNAEGEKFVVDGSFVNAGLLDASKAETTIVGGSLANSGEARYDDMRIAEGGTSVNSGREEGDVLTVEGSHGNTDTSIWNGITVEENGTLVNGLLGEDGTPDVDALLKIGTGSDHDAFIIRGDAVNNGTLNAAEVETTEGEGALFNRGDAAYDDLSIAEGGTSVNAGREEGDILTVAGTHENTGTSIWNSMTVTADGNELNRKYGELLVGSEAADEQLTVDGKLINEGLLDASNAEDTVVGGTLANSGEARYDDLTVEAGGSSKNLGYEQGDILMVEGSHENSGVSIWNGIVVTGTGAAVNTETGKVDVNGRFDVEGSYENKGDLDARDTTMTIVSGELVNSGHAEYDDLTVQTGGRSENSGSEQGDFLTVGEGAEHANTGSSIWNNVTITGIAANDGRLEIGSEDGSGEAFVVEGAFTNNGDLDAAKAENTVISGELVNNGHAAYDDMLIVGGGRSENVGYEKGDILTIEEGSEHVNTGTSIWNNVTVSGDAVSDGRLEVGSDEGTGSEFVVDGSFTNKGELDATGVGTSEVAGELINIGRADYDDLSILEDGRSENAGFEQGDILNVYAGGVWDNSGEAHWNNVNLDGGRADNSGSLEAGKIVIGDGSEISNTGSITAGELELSGGVLDLGAGGMKADKTFISGGDVVVGNRKPLADENRVDFDIAESEPVNGDIWVIGNGDVSFGKDAATYAEAVGAPNIPDIASRVTLTGQVVVGETGSIAVGSDVWVDADNHRDVGDGNLYFGSDSLTVADVSKFGHDIPMFKGVKDGATVTVEKGAKLMLGSITEEGDYIITDGFLTGGSITDNTWTGGWTGLDLWAPNEDGSGLKWLLDLNHDEKKIWVTAVLEDILSVYPAVSVPNNVNEALRNCRNATSPDQLLTCTVIKNHALDKAEKTRILNSVAEMGLSAGYMATAMNDAAAAVDSLENRISMLGDAFRSNGAMAQSEKGHTLWVDILGGKSSADSYAATGNVSNGFDSTSYGFIAGADHKFDGRDLILGGALSYADGSLDSTGDLLPVKTDRSTIGLHAYGAWKPTEKTNLVGTFSYMRQSADATMQLPAGIGLLSAKNSTDTDMLVLGLRGEGHLQFGYATVIPHAGLQLVYAKTGTFDTEIDGVKAYSNTPDTTTTFRMPIGASVRVAMHAGGWNIIPQADLTVTPQFGDVSQSMTVQGAGGKAKDVIEGDFTSKFTTKLDLAVRAESRTGFSAGVRYGFTKGGEGKADHAFRLELRKTF